MRSETVDGDDDTRWAGRQGGSGERGYIPIALKAGFLVDKVMKNHELGLLWLRKAVWLSGLMEAGKEGGTKKNIW